MRRERDDLTDKQREALDKASEEFNENLRSLYDSTRLTWQELQQVAEDMGEDDEQSPQA